MRKLLTALFLLMACGVLLGQSLPEQYRNFGTLIVTQLVSAPFPHPARAEGHKYKTEFYPADTHYQDNTVAIFIPKGFHASNRVDLVVHFHGWRNHVEKVLSHYQLIEQFALAGRNAILVVPQGPRDAPDSFGGKLEDEGGFKRFVDDVMAALPKDKFVRPQPGRVILSGHSGGYHVMAGILARGGLTDHIAEVWLFDALYADTDKFVHWFEQGHRRFLDIYTTDGGTKSETEALINSLRQKQTPLFQGQEAAVNQSDLQTNQLVFLFTELPHDVVPQAHKTFFEFLKTSCLDGKVAQLILPPARQNVPGTRVSLKTGELFAPDFYKPNSNAVDLVLFFHGAAWCAEQNFYSARKQNAVLLAVNEKTTAAVAEKKVALADLAASALRGLSSNHLAAQSIRHICLASFSGGYIAVRALLSASNSLDQITDVVLADSLYAPRFSKSPNQLDPAALKPFLDYARRAAEGQCHFLFSQLYPPEEKYRDNTTTLAANYLIDNLHAPRQPGLTRNSRGVRVLYRSDKGNFHLLGYDGMVNQDHFEHFYGISDLLKETSFATIPQ